jgi:murein L,D-transpeptidase YafK
MQGAKLLVRVIAVATVLGALGFAGLQMAASHQMNTPSATPDRAIERNRRLAEKGMSPGSPIVLRIFKAEFEFELWMRKNDRFELFATYPICYWSGTLGPKLHEGDMQAPEGFYTVGAHQLHRRGRWPRSLNIGYPNALDRAHARTGSLILVHGGCTSTGCFAMTDPVMEDIYALAEQALQHGQERIPVHVFPFRMTEANLAARAPVHGEWGAFWLTLKVGYDLFERTHLPPKVGICNKQYTVAPGSSTGAVGPPTNLDVACPESDGGGALPLVSGQTEAAVASPSAGKSRNAATRAASRRHKTTAARQVRKAVGGQRRVRAPAAVATSSLAGAEDLPAISEGSPQRAAVGAGLRNENAAAGASDSASATWLKARW